MTDKIAIIACRPVVWTSMPKPYSDLPQTTVYPGSTTGLCMVCETPVWVGPIAQEAMMLVPDAQVRCFACVTQLISEAPPSLMHLGNTFKPRHG